MAQVTSAAGYSGPNFVANLPVVPQKSFTPHGGLNGLETLIAVVVPSNQTFTGSKKTSYG